MPHLIQGPIAIYRQRLQSGDIRHDPAQELAAEKLQSLHHALVNYVPQTGKSGWKARFGLTRRRIDPPQGLYMYGEVGRGKSMLMDLFFATAQIENKRRVHFNAFMQEVHARLNALRKSTDKTADDPIPSVAADLAEDAWLLCFDEFQVDNIADAMILGRLFEALFNRGVVVIATSNRPPQDLYKNGLQRERFLPFIQLFCDRLDLLELRSETDYRLGRLKGKPVYLTPLSEETDKDLENYFHAMTHDVTAGPCLLSVMGRNLEIPLATEGVAFSDFDRLCRRPLGSADYLEIAQRFHTLVLARIPRLGPEDRNEARRFVTLIDTLYEHNVNLICSAEVEPSALYSSGDGTFEFQRTVSRLMEMQSAGYLSQTHEPG